MLEHFYNTADASPTEIDRLLTRAIEIKEHGAPNVLSRRELMLIFLNPSLRTRVSFETGMRALDGNVSTLDMEKDAAYAFEYEEGVKMDGAKSEHVREAASVLSRYCNAIAIRASELITADVESKNSTSWSRLKQDQLFQRFMEYGNVPIINMESNLYHPCQGLGDALTMKERFEEPSDQKYVLTWAYHPKALPVATPHSQALSACDLGMEVTVTHPPGWELDQGVIEKMHHRAEETGAELSFHHDQTEAVAEADVVCAKSWAALEHFGNWSEEHQRRKQYEDWIVDRELMRQSDNAYFMHCLPVRRNVVVTDEVLDSSRSIVYDQAENRKWAQMAMLEHLLAPSNQ